MKYCLFCSSSCYSATAITCGYSGGPECHSHMHCNWLSNAHYYLETSRTSSRNYVSQFPCATGNNCDQQQQRGVLIALPLSVRALVRGVYNINIMIVYYTKRTCIHMDTFMPMKGANCSEILANHCIHVPQVDL